jgi:hypothetical protein
MGDLQAIQKFLCRDPIMQAMFEAEANAIMPLQHELLDAVLMDDHRKIAELLDEEDHGRLLEGRFFMALAIILIGQGSIKAIKAFADHGYGASTKPAQLGSPSDLTLGQIALWTCDALRQKELVEAKFLILRQYDFLGMGSVEPDVFDLWSDLHIDADVSRPQTVPQANLNIFRWLPEIGRKVVTGQSQVVRGEMERRLDKMVTGFLDTHYRTENAFERWQAFTAIPPSVTAHSGSIAESGVFMKVFVDHQLKFAPELREHKVGISLAGQQLAGHKALLAHALLKSGFALSDFDCDLSGEILANCVASLRRGENPTAAVGQLWNEVYFRMEKECPERLSSLPVEISKAGSSLQLLKSWGSDAERVAFCDMLDMQLKSPATQRSAPRMRL